MLREYRWRGSGLVVLLLALLGTAGTASGQERSESPPRVLTLEEALRLALRDNRDLEDARLAYEGAEGQVREAWSSVYPTLDLTAGFTRNLSVPQSFLPRIIFDPDADPNELVAVKFGADNQWSFQLRAEQPLFEASAFIGVGAADRYRRLQGEVVRGRSIEIAARVKVVYYDVLLADEAVRLSENTVRRVRRTLEETRAMNEAGLASSYDVLRLEVELSNLEPALRRARNGAAAARRRLAIELNLPGLDSVEVAGSLADVDAGAGESPKAGDAGALVPVSEQTAGLILSEAPAVLSRQAALELARASRSDLRQLELTAQLRHTELRVEQAEYLPKVSLFGSYSINAQQNGRPVFFGESNAERSYGRQVGVQVTLPVFGGFRRPARIEQRRVALQQAVAQRDLLSDRVENEVATLLEQVEEARTRAHAQRSALKQATRGYEIASAQYREGISSQLEVTDAEVALRQSEFNLAEAVYDYLVARARLDEALGLEPRVATDGRLSFNREDEGTR